MFELPILESFGIFDHQTKNRNLSLEALEDALEFGPRSNECARESGCIMHKLRRNGKI